jgi:hypothetical protein
MRTLLSRHTNLFSAFRIVAGGPRPVQPLDETETLKPEWRQLIEDYPDRFTMHTDIFYLPTWPPLHGPKRSHELARKMLAQLPENIARKLAYENTRRIYRLGDK